MAIRNLNAVGSAEDSTAIESQTNQKIKKGGILNVLLTVLLVVLVALGTFMYFQKGKVLAETTQIEQDNKVLTAQVDELKQNKVVVSKVASDALIKIAKDELRWSDIITEVNKLLPQDSSGAMKINVLSYSGSNDGKIALNIVTVAAGLPPYDDVSRLLSIFNSSVFFKNAYIPSISKGINSEGNTTLSFVLNLLYQKPETGLVDLNFGGESAVKSNVPVARNPNLPKVAPTN